MIEEEAAFFFVRSALPKLTDEECWEIVRAAQEAS